MTPRPVDEAMVDERPEKIVVRQLWVEEARCYAEEFPDDAHPLYLTLPGGLGLDVKALVDEGLLELTETGAISEAHQFRVVGVEHNGLAVARLNRRFPGMKIIEMTIENLLGWQSPFSWPVGENRRFCKARLVNLDLNGPLLGRPHLGGLEFPVMVAIDKLSRLHEAPQRLRWTLCLTLHATTPWSDHVAEQVQAFMVENLARDDEFRARCRETLGADFCERLGFEEPVGFSALGREDQQRFLMVFVPKKIAQMVHNRGWRIVTKHNLRYGSPPRAPMATWVLEFLPDEAVIATPDAGYREALRGIFQRFGSLNAEGEFEAA